jgi:uncharacterized membrane protein YdjX (TVP38/TMEM64 family)/uncharacterized membrane protein YbhN (UPF0104 family)
MTTADFAPTLLGRSRDGVAGGTNAARSFRIRSVLTVGLRALIVGVVVAYASTSLVVVANATGNATGDVWLPSFPDWYYVTASWLYRPFAWWFALLGPMQAWPDIDYSTFAWVSRAPFLAAPFAMIAGWRARPDRRRVVVLGTFVAALFSIVGAQIGAHVLARFGLREAVEAAARDAGSWGPVVLFGLMVAQAVPTPVPTIAITMVAGLLYGVVFGAAVAWSGAMVAASVSFGLGRRIGRPVVARFGGARALEMADRLSGGGAFRAVLVSRLVPAVSFRATSLAAGLLPIRLPAFLVATGIGQLPGTIAYAALGASLVGDASTIAWTAGGVGLIAGGVWLTRGLHAIAPDVRERMIASAKALFGSARFRFGASAVLLTGIAWRLGAGQIGAAIRDAEPLWLLAAVLTTVGALIVSTWKWHLLLRGVGIDAPFGQLFEAYLIGQFFNNVLPSNVGGDVARAHLVGKATGRMAIVAGTIVGERLIAGLALVATSLAALASSPWLLGPVGSALAVTAIAFVSMSLACASPAVRARAVRALGTEGRRGAVSRAIEGVGATLARPSIVVPVFGLSMVFQALVIAVAWFGFKAVRADIPIDATVALIPVISALQLVPVSVGGLGVREGAYAVLFAACCGTPAPVAVAASLVFAGVVGFVSIAGGVRFAVSGRVSTQAAFPEVRELAEVIQQVERETWFDADWLWKFADGMRGAGRPTEQTIAAIRRQGDANRLPTQKRYLRRVQLLGRVLDPRRVLEG